MAMLGYGPAAAVVRFAFLLFLLLGSCEASKQRDLRKILGQTSGLSFPVGTPVGYSCYAGVSLPGSVLDTPQHSSSTEACAEACNSEPRCTFFFQNHTSGTCALKKGLWDWREGGVKTGAYMGSTTCIKEGSRGNAPALAGTLCYQGVMIRGAIFEKVTGIADLAACAQHCLWSIDCEFIELWMTGECFLKGDPFRGYHGHNGPDGGVVATCIMAPGAPGPAAVPAPPPPPTPPGHLYAPSFEAWPSKPVWDKCGGKCLAIVGIPCPVNHVEARHRLRQTYQQPALTPSGIRYVFIITAPRGLMTYNRTALREEFEKHEDMLLLSVKEHIPGGFRKTFAFFEWAETVAGASRSEFWVKTDMDTLLNPYALKLLLLKLPRVRTFWGRFVGTVEELSSGQNRGFFNGPLYLLSSDLVHSVVSQSSATAFKSKYGELVDAWEEDQRLSALVREILPIKHWRPAMSCEIIWEPEDKAWTTPFTAGKLSNCTIAQHHLKDPKEWREYFARMLPAMLAWRKACEPTGEGVHLEAHWGSDACHELSVRPADCGW